MAEGGAIHPKDPTLAAILSALFPGGGQLYCQQWVRGILFFLGVFLLSPLGFLLSAGIWVWGIIDAYRLAQALQGATGSGEGQVIDVSALRLPSVDWKRVLLYTGIPVGIASLLLVVIVIMTLRSGFMDANGSGEKLRNLAKMIETYKTKTGAYPDSLDKLIDPTDPLEKKQILDPWGKRFIYRPAQDGFDLFSAGKDGQPGSSDDIQYRS